MNKIIIFGAGETKSGLNKYAIRKANKMGVEVLFLVDNDEKKYGTVFQCDNIEYKVLPVKNIMKVVNEDIFVIIATEIEHKEIEQQLIDLGVGTDKFSYIKKMKDFYNYNEHMYCKVQDGCYGVMKDGKLYPDMLHIDMTTYCNCRCEYCWVHGDIYKNEIKNVTFKHMEWEVLKQIVNQVKEIDTIKVITNSRSGELFIHPQWFEMNQYIAENTGISTVCISTNGMLLNEENINKLLRLKYDKILIRVSIDGRNAKENDNYRKGSKWEVIKKNLHMLLEKMDARFKVVIANTLIPSEDKVIEVINGSLSECQYLMDEFGDKVTYNSIPAVMNCYYHKKYEYEMIRHMKLSGIKKIKEYNGEACNFPFSSLSIDVEGNILMCNCEPTRDVVIGNIMKDKALDVWNGEFMNTIRQCYEKGTAVKECESCNLNMGEDHYIYVLCKPNDLKS